jgi:hypothetical protein
MLKVGRLVLVVVVAVLRRPHRIHSVYVVYLSNQLVNKIKTKHTNGKGSRCVSSPYLMLLLPLSFLWRFDTSRSFIW